MQYVVVGAGPAGVVAAETLRKVDPAGAVTLIGGEPEPPYSRMAIPYMLTGKVGEDGTHLRPAAGHYDARGITVINDRVARVDPATKTVVTESGASHAYDRLLLATGSHPVRPPVPGLDLPGVHHCWTLADARAIAEKATEGRHVVQMGAGFIGCIIMESLWERGVKLSVIETADRMVPRMMDTTGGALIKQWCANKDIDVHTSASVTAVEPNPAGPGDKLVRLSDGTGIDADLVVVATGVHAYTEFLDGTGIQVDRGIVVDDHMRTTVPDIYAAGDCAQGRDFSTGGYDVHAIQPTAVEHGRTAAMNMAGIDVAYQGSLIMNVLDTVGLITCSFGRWDGVPGGDTARVVDEGAYRYMCLQFDGDVLVGALSLGRTDHMGVVRGLIQNRTRLGPWKQRLMEDPNRVMDAYVSLSQVAGT